MTQQVFTDTDLIGLAQRGNMDAFGELYQRHMDAIFKYVSRRVSETNEAEDVTQTVFMKAWQALARYQPSKAPFRAWLYTIAQNTIIDHYRAKKPTLPIGDHQDALFSHHDLPEDNIMSQEQRESLQRAMTKLRPNYREVLSMRFLHGMDYSETAKAMGREVNAVRVMQFRALSALQKVMQQHPLAWILVAATMFAMTMGGGVAAAQGSLPGDILYPIKTLVEDARLALAGNAEDVDLHIRYADERVDEIKRLLAEQRYDDIPVTVSKFEKHLAEAVNTLHVVVETDPVHARELASETGEMLATQAVELTALLDDAPSETG
ncbi:MAG: sigma-70 family RNA polymerase sigma factor, partial [Okeania sp. SIO3B3]|nr:sigma-70 family RNA polymerase sigma factor [Okeania sp. SIO3B3]